MWYCSDQGLCQCHLRAVTMQVRVCGNVRSRSVALQVGVCGNVRENVVLNPHNTRTTLFESLCYLFFEDMPPQIPLILEHRLAVGNFRGTSAFTCAPPRKMAVYCNFSCFRSRVTPFDFVLSSNFSLISSIFDLNLLFFRG